MVELAECLDPQRSQGDDSMTERAARQNSLIPPGSIWRWIMIGFLMVVGLVVRFDQIASPPILDTTRQFHSAVIARGKYRATLDSLPEWQREIAQINQENQGKIEPPIMETLTVWVYRIIGEERLWIGGGIAAIFWVIGSVFLFLIAEHLFNRDAAVFAAAFYLLLPYTIEISRSFQPDSLMIMMQLFSLYLIVLYFDHQKLSLLIGAAVVTGLGLLIKPITLFVTFSAFGVLALQKHQSLKRAIKEPQLWLFAAISLTPSIIYYINGLFISGFMANQTQVQFRPRLFLMERYWIGWFVMIYRALGFMALIGGLFGLFMLRPGQLQTFLFSLWVGYLIFALVFNYAIHTHDYYQLQLIWITAISLCPLIVVLAEQLAARLRGRLSRLAVVGLAITVLAIVRMMENRRSQIRVETFDPITIQIAPEIGELVGHSDHVIAISPAYSMSLFFYGEMAGQHWMPFDLQEVVLPEPPLLNIKDHIDPEADYFIVTDFYEFGGQAELQAYLYDNYPVLKETNTYIIFDLRGD
jgi:4-amino-4-deoxy-L-arabinose transferase-like glycosyltransferase